MFLRYTFQNFPGWGVGGWRGGGWRGKTERERERDTPVILV